MLIDRSDNLYQPSNLCIYNKAVIKTKRVPGYKTPPKQKDEKPIPIV
jgi:hypothetical protein